MGRVHARKARKIWSILLLFLILAFVPLVQPLNAQIDSFSAFPMSGPAPLRVAFTATGTVANGECFGTDDQWEFRIDFGDGTPKESSLTFQPNGSHTYLEWYTYEDPGLYLAQIEVWCTGEFPNKVISTQMIEVEVLEGCMKIPTAMISDISPEMPVIIGERVELTATSDNFYACMDLVYDWRLTSKPAGSAASLDEFTGPSASFVADRYGTYDVSVCAGNEMGSVSHGSVLCDSTSITTEMSELSVADTLITSLPNEIADGLALGRAVWHAGMRIGGLEVESVGGIIAMPANCSLNSGDADVANLGCNFTVEFPDDFIHDLLQHARGIMSDMIDPQIYTNLTFPAEALPGLDPEAIDGALTPLTDASCPSLFVEDEFPAIGNDPAPDVEGIMPFHGDSTPFGNLVDLPLSSDCPLNVLNLDGSLSMGIFVPDQGGELGGIINSTFESLINHAQSDLGVAFNAIGAEVEFGLDVVDFKPTTEYYEIPILALDRPELYIDALNLYDRTPTTESLIPIDLGETIGRIIPVEEQCELNRAEGVLIVPRDCHYRVLFTTDDVNRFISEANARNALLSDPVNQPEIELLAGFFIPAALAERISNSAIPGEVGGEKPLPSECVVFETGLIDSSANTNARECPVNVRFADGSLLLSWVLEVDDTGTIATTSQDHLNALASALDNLLNALLFSVAEDVRLFLGSVIVNNN